MSVLKLEMPLIPSSTKAQKKTDICNIFELGNLKGYTTYELYLYEDSRSGKSSAYDFGCVLGNSATTKLDQK